MKQEPGNASSQESPGFSRGEEVNTGQTEQLYRLLMYSTPGPWETEHERVGKLIRPVRLAVDMTDIDNILLAKHAPELAAQVAGLTEEWGVQLGDGREVGAGWGSREQAERDQRAWEKDGYPARLVLRYVSAGEVVGDD